MSERRELARPEGVQVAKHEPNWVEDKKKSTDKTIVFKCAEDGCHKSYSMSRFLYEEGRAMPSLSTHS